MFDLEFFEKCHYPITRSSFGDTDTSYLSCYSCGGHWPCAMGGAVAEIKRLKADEVELSRLRAEVENPATITEDVDGMLVVNWPEGQRTCRITEELLYSFILSVNELTRLKAES